MNSSEFARQLVQIAQEERGKGESGANNKGPDVDKYCGGHGRATGGPWCAAFVSWCIEQAMRRVFCELPEEHGLRSHNAKKLLDRVARHGRAVTREELRTGDLICWHRGKDGSRQGHIGIVVYADQQMVQTIEGNVGAYPALVKMLTHDTTHERIYGYARLISDESKNLVSRSRQTWMRELVRFVRGIGARRRIFS